MPREGNDKSNPWGQLKQLLPSPRNDEHQYTYSTSLWTQEWEVYIIATNLSSPRCLLDHQPGVKAITIDTFQYLLWETTRTDLGSQPGLDSRPNHLSIRILYHSNLKRSRPIVLAILIDSGALARTWQARSWQVSSWRVVFL